MQEPNYPFALRCLTDAEGGGFLIEFPDLPGCVSDGETIQAAIQNGIDALSCWIDAAKKSGKSIPQPGSFESQSGKWLQRAPKSLHYRLIEQAKEEGVSLNTLIIAMLSEALGRKGKTKRL